MGDIASGDTTVFGEFNKATYGGPGYNCKGYVWIGDSQIRALWDTGATRNTIDREFLLKLLADEDSRNKVVKVIPLEKKIVMKTFSSKEKPRWSNPKLG